MIEKLFDKPLWQMTGEELFTIVQAASKPGAPQPDAVIDTTNKKYVFGLKGLADLLGCCKTTALRIKNEGKLAPAIKQYGRKIVIDAEMALELFGRKTGGRK